MAGRDTPDSSQSSESFKFELHESSSNHNQVATHVPDLIVRSVLDIEIPSVRNFEGVLMFVDISGFTALCEKFASMSGSGTDKLSRTLNEYLGAIVENILSSDGDVLQFAGDAFLAVWTVKNQEDFKNTVSTGLRCGLTIQKKCDNWQTDVGIKLRVKIGLAAGPMYSTYFGNSESCMFAVTGGTVEDVNQAEKFAESASVTLSPTAWSYIPDKDSMVYESLSDGKHIRVKSVRTGELRPLQTAAVTHTRLVPDDIVSVRPLSKPGNITRVNLRGLASFVRKLSSVIPIIANKAITEESEDEDGQELTKRQAVFDASSKAEEEKLRLYVMGTVLQKIDDDLPLEYLSEMRQVTIIFINLTLAKGSKRDEGDALQSAFNIIHNSLKRYHGRLNKVFMFDKGCTFLAIFGLPGDKHEDDCAHALQCSHKMHDLLKSTPSIIQVSIGVTTGKTFCGVVGHKYRHEYTVIGSKVNMSARLMMHYPGRLSCDPETFHHSKLSAHFFNELGHREMKGVQNPGIIREYVENKKTSEKQIEDINENEFPLLGRKTELKQFLDELHLITEHREKGEHRRVIVYEGEPGIGTTRMIEECIRQAVSEQIRVVSCSLTLHDSSMPYHTVTALMELLLEMKNCANHVEREHTVLEHIKEEYLKESLCLLNDLLGLKFPAGPKYVHMACNDRTDALHHLLVSLVHQFTIDTCIIFAVDDAHFIDKDSWEFIIDLAEDSSAVCLLAMKPFPVNKASCSSAAKVLQNPYILHIKLQGIPQEFLEELACQILNVTAIPKELLKILKERSHGVASWCEQLINDMFITSKIKVVREIKKILKDDNNSPVTVKRVCVVSEESGHLDLGNDGRDCDEPDMEKEQEEEADEINIQEMTSEVCVIAPNVNLSEIPVPDSMKGMLLSRIDRLKSADQMVVKCAAVLGLTFTRSMLEAVVPNTSSKRIRMALHSLMQSRIFECATPKTHNASQGSHGHHYKLSSRVECHCPRKLESSMDAHSNIGNCKMLRFKTSMMQEVAYTLFLNEQRRSLHEQAALFLESRAHKCRSCGGGEFVPHYQSLSHNIAENKPDDRRTSTSSSAPSSASASGSRRRAKSRTSKKHRVSNRSFQKDKGGRLESLCEQDDAAPRRSSILDSVMNLFKRNSKVGDEDELEELEAASARRGRRTSLAFSEKLRHDIGGEVINEELLHRGIDLRDCECPQVLASVYPQLVMHWKAASNTARTIHFLTEAGGAAIATHNNMTGLSYLLEVHEMLKLLKSGKKPLPDDPEDKPEIEDEERARVESLIGQALFHMGRIEEAMPHHKRALKALGNKQPTTIVGVYFRLLIEHFTQRLHLKYPDKYVGHASVADCNRYVEQARCLSHMWHGYHDAHDDIWALFTALQHVNRAEKADDDFHDLMEGYCIMMESCHALLWFRQALVYEELALQRCNEVCKFTADDLSTLGHLYYVVMSLRLADGRIQKAMEAGFQALKVSEILHDNSLKLAILPNLAHALLYSNKLSACVEVLQQLDYISEEEEDAEGRDWYFCSCLDILLEAGFALETHDKCVEFVKRTAKDPAHSAHIVPRFYMSACLTLWFSRKGNWHQADEWFMSSVEYMPETFESFMAANAFTKIVESQLLAYCHALRSYSDVAKMKKLGISAISRLRTICKKFPTLNARLHHMQGYYHKLSDNEKQCHREIEKGLSQSESLENVLEHQWMEHSQIVWFDPDHSAVQDEFWQLATEDDLDWHMAEALNGEITKYSLPLPHQLLSKTSIV